MPTGYSQRWEPAALSQPYVPYPLPAYLQQRQSGGAVTPKPRMGYSYTMPWSQIPGTMGFPGDMASYAKRFQDSSSTMDGAAQYGNTAAYNMHLEQNAFNNKPLGAKRKAMGLPKMSDVRNYGAGAGGGGLAGSYQQAMDAANQANEARYGDILRGYQSRYDRVMGLLDGMGQQEGRDINEQYDQSFARGQQDLIGRGLGNSTVMSTMRMGNDRERASSLGRLNERVRQQAMSTDTGLSGDLLSFMERRNDVGPNLEMLARLYQQQGASGYGYGGGGGYGYGGGGGYGPDLGTAWINTGGFPAGSIMDGSMAGFGSGGGYTPLGNFGGTLNRQQQLLPTAAQRLANTPNSRMGYGEYGRAGGGPVANTRQFYNWPDQEWLRPLHIGG